MAPPPQPEIQSSGEEGNERSPNEGKRDAFESLVRRLLAVSRQEVAERERLWREGRSPPKSQWVYDSNAEIYASNAKAHFECSHAQGACQSLYTAV